MGSSPKTGTSSTVIRVLTVDDHALIRDGVAALIANQKDMRLVGEASNGREAIEQFRSHRPDITLMDLQMPEMNGIDALIAIRSEFPDARIIVLTSYAGDALSGANVARAHPAPAPLTTKATARPAAVGAFCERPPPPNVATASITCFELIPYRASRSGFTYTLRVERFP